ncbi:T9SS type A sorting domain-containing protein [Flavobacterium paronense]|nr:T9SS type A sorting domain-containing protein [Flavobacterium paronense]MDN3675857.1 T9SS type A sorting domain-containing protein [Flavobacterium paronense]MDN3675860.1 T9SS type A sorting domain-containing protein [Flavobacterium paronense]
MDFISAIPTQTYQNPSLLTWDYVNLLPFETREIEVKININTPMETLPVNNGDIIKFQSIVSPLSGDEYLTDNANRLSQVVVGSIDPNDKTCVEGDKVEPDMIGEYVHYVIRFENTGTYAAENIVVKDLIDTDKFDISTLFPLNGSHSYITKITNTNQVEFIFENINLPFDNANNDGYVTFKIKTKPTLVVGDSFSNTANIYFDYNFPIVTNTATTTITALGNQDFEFTNLFSLSPVPAKNSLTITTKQNVTISSVSIYNTLGQLVQVNTNPNETIDVSELKAGNYFIKIVSDKGTASSKFVKE